MIGCKKFLKPLQFNDIGTPLRPFIIASAALAFIYGYLLLGTRDRRKFTERKNI